jgi:small conductance mechanosensitive channel
VLEALRQAGKVATALEAPAPFAAVSSYGESAINYILQVWCTSADYWATLFAVNENVKAVFDAQGVTMTYPHLNVHLDK